MRRGLDGKAAATVAAAFIFWGVFAVTVVNPVVIYDEVLFFVTALAGPDLAAAQARHAAVLSSGALLYPELVGALARLRLPPEAAAKALNVMAFTAAAAWLAAKSRRLADGRRSAVVAVVLLFAPVGTFAAFFMPECLYFALAAAAVAVLLGGDGDEDARPGMRAAGAGALLALATLTKPHGLVLALALAAALAARATLGGGWRAGVLDLAAAGAGFAATFVAGHALVTPPGLARRDLLGPEYRAQLENLSSGVAELTAGLALGVTYLAAVLTLVGPTLVVLGAAVATRGRAAWSGAQGRARTAAVLVLTALALLLASVPAVVAAEPAVIHLRYFDFLFPVAFAVAARLSPGGRPDVEAGTARIGAALWMAGAGWLAWRLPHLRPLGVATPDLFFLYGGAREFGAFGLGRWVRPVLLLTVAGGAAALASGRVSWVRAQAAVLIVFTLLALPNIRRFDAALMGSEAADRGVGKTARALCGRGPDDVAAIGTATNFVPLYASLYALKRPAPLLLSKAPATLFAAQPAGRCVLTTLPLPAGRYERLAGSPAVTLARVR